QHPENPYIQNVSIPRLNRFKAKFPELLKVNSH
ncbi:MAG TPA: peptide-methionine (S)-S-oxide reductase, partial [Leeuwenhoekiella sp.]|nr:peptide-methionine (S)-S-oxide reductase [Leeuwenhoekiella sp.]